MTTKHRPWINHMDRALTHTLIDPISAWANKQKVPFSMEAVISQLGLNQQRVTTDFIKRLSHDLRVTGFIKVHYLPPETNVWEIRWITKTNLESLGPQTRIRLPAASPKLDALIAAERERARPRFPLLAVPQDPQITEADLSDDTGHAPTAKALPQRLSQWLVAVAQWFRSFPVLR